MNSMKKEIQFHLINPTLEGR